MANRHASEAEIFKPCVLKEGHLLKLARSVLKQPKLNYYVLKPSGIYYFAGKQGDVLRGFIPLDEISLSLGTVGENNSHLMYCVKIADRRKVHVLACHSTEIRDSWITAILTAVAQRLVNEPNLNRRQLASSGSSSDSEVFPDSQFTSPFWVSQDGQRRKSRAGRLSVAEILTHKTNWPPRSRKKNFRSKSLSLEDIQIVYQAAVRPKPPSTRKLSIDFTRHLFGLGTKSTVDDELEDDPKMTALTGNPANKTNGKKRWSLFNMASFGTPFENGDRKKHCATKHESLYENCSSLICDTKL